MFNHQPTDYRCPFCDLLAGKPDDYNNLDDFVYQNEYATALIASKWWPSNPGHVLVIPNSHFENLYDISEEVVGEVYKVVKKLSIAIRSTYDCQGISTRQHNEPAGNQDVWHFHTHVFPRYENDDFYVNFETKSFVDADARRPYAEKLRAYFASSKP